MDCIARPEFSVFMVSLDVTVVVVSLGRIQHDLGLSQSELPMGGHRVFAGICSVPVISRRAGRSLRPAPGILLRSHPVCASVRRGRPGRLGRSTKRCGVPCRGWRSIAL